MSKQIFKKNVPIHFLYDFLDKICESANNNYIFDINAYKKMLYYNHQIDFLKEIKPYYYSSKQYYLEREISYNSIITILRQISKSHKLIIVSKMKYIDSNYVIEYNIPILTDRNELKET